MAYRDTDIGLTIRLDPTKGKRQLLRLFTRHEGNTTHVAKAVGVDVATVKRWIVKCGTEFRAEIEALRPEKVDAA
jgi:hypothetical protein